MPAWNGTDTLGDAAGSESDLRDALQLARQSKDTYLEASVLGNLGFLRMSSSQIRRGHFLVRPIPGPAGSAPGQSLDGTRPQQHRLLLCTAWKSEKATPLFERAARLAADTGDLTDRYISLGRLADSYPGQR